METKSENGDHELEMEIIEKTMKKKKKLSRGMHIFSVILFMIRRRRRHKLFNSGFWRRVVEPIRKVRSEAMITQPSSDLVDTICLPPPPNPDMSEKSGGGDESGERLTEVFTAASSSSSSGISGYGSAMSLRDLDYHYDDDDDDDDDEDECFSEVEGGDDMIDEKAEEFILKFYEQMKMQNQVYTERCKAKGILKN